MNKIKESLEENIITKERLKMQIENEIENKETKKPGTYLKPIGFTLASLVILFLAGFYVLGNGNFLNNKENDDNNNGKNKKEIFASQMSKGANYSMTILLNLDNYLEENDYISYIDNPTVMRLSNRDEDIIEIDAKEIIDADEFATCSGKVTIEKETNVHNYTIDTECSDDPEGSNSLTIKRYDGINNFGLNALHRLEPVNGGYIGLFDYSKSSATKCKSDEYECKYDGFALAYLNDDGNINNIKGITREDLGYGYDKAIYIGDFFVLDDGYYISYRVGGNELYKEVPFVDQDSSWLAKFDMNLDLVWNKNISEIGGTIGVMQVGKSIGLVEAMSQKNVRIHLFDEAMDEIIRVIEIENTKDDSTIFYANNSFYHLNEVMNSLEGIDNVGLNRLNINGNNIFSKDIKAYLDDAYSHTDYLPQFERGRRLIANNTNIFILNHTNYYDRYFISVFNQDGEFIRNHSTVLYDRVVYEYKNQYSLIQGTNDLKFTIDTFDNNGELLSNKYFESYSDDSYYNNEYLATNEGLICFSSSYNNDGTLLLLYFN